jgi:hypothetical protein
MVPPNPGPRRGLPPIFGAQLAAHLDHIGAYFSDAATYRSTSDTTGRPETGPVRCPGRSAARGRRSNPAARRETRETKPQGELQNSHQRRLSSRTLSATRSVAATRTRYSSGCSREDSSGPTTPRRLVGTMTL